MTDEQTGVTQELEQASSSPELEGAADPQSFLDDSGENTEAAAQEKTVPLSALEDERHKRQEADRALGQIQAQLNYLEQQYNGLVSAKDREPELDKVDPDDFATIADLDKFVEKKTKKIQEEYAKKELQRSFEIAKKSNPDFEDVYNYARTHLRHMEPVFSSSPDPVQAMYDFAKYQMDQNGSSKKEVEARKKIVEQTNKNVNRPQTLTEARGSSNPEDDPNWFGKLSKEKRDEVWEEFKRGKRSFFK